MCGVVVVVVVVVVDVVLCYVFKIVNYVLICILGFCIVPSHRHVFACLLVWTCFICVVQRFIFVPFNFVVLCLNNLSYSHFY